MRRRSSSLLLLCATAAVSIAAVFGVQLAERPGPVVREPELTPVFSPEGEGPRTAQISFRLREHQPVTVSVIDSDGTTVHSEQARPTASGRVTVHWNGNADARGATAPDGTYAVAVTLHDSGRELVIPSTIELDTTPPRIAESVMVRTEDDRDRFVMQASLNEEPRRIRLQRGSEQIAPLRRRRPEAYRIAASWERVRLWFPLQPGTEPPGDDRLIVIDRAGNRASAAISKRPDRPAP